MARALGLAGREMTGRRQITEDLHWAMSGPIALAAKSLPQPLYDKLYRSVNKRLSSVVAPRGRLHDHQGVDLQHFVHSVLEDVPGCHAILGLHCQPVVTWWCLYSICIQLDSFNSLVF